MSTTNRFSDQGDRAPGYEWAVAGKPVVVHLDLDVVDRMSREMMRGFGVVPRRGVEVGGILLGSIDPGSTQAVVRIEDFEPVACSHSRGASYLLSEEEQRQFEEGLARWQAADGRRTYAVGYYRSHTRQGLGLSEEDLDIYKRCFSDAASVALLVKPFATRASVGAFFFREEGLVRTESSYQEFPFRRRELGGEAQESSEVDDAGETEATPFPGRSYPVGNGAAAPGTAVEEATARRPSGKKMKSGWIWIPLSFIFLLLGVILGFQIALSVNVKLPAGLRQDPYTLSLSVTPAGDSVHVRWDRSSPAIRSSTGGSLLISDGGNEKTVALDAGQLRNGSVIYRRMSGDLRFRLEVFARDRVSVSESLNYRLNPARAK
ncbi:MAG: hypothetical protein JJE04_11100 [Acidobacteriia bacterium]|nr:hypothetical protein [Terriglobia bacterium]